MNRQNLLIGKVEQESFEVLRDEEGWYEVSFRLLNIHTGELSKFFVCWYCDAYEKLMLEYKESNWDRRFHWRVHQNLTQMIRLYRREN